MRLTVWLFEILAGQGDDLRALGVRLCVFRGFKTLPDLFVEPGRHHLCPVDLVAGAGEVRSDRTQMCNTAYYVG